jgi:farnesyl-diphosphate farnesyltransferase
VLRDVSRSFYLTLWALPKEVRDQIGVAYLLARAADTIADTRVVPREERLARLLMLRKQLEQEISEREIQELQRQIAPHQSLPAEKMLLERLHQCFSLFMSFRKSDQQRIADVVVTLTRGMEFDLTRFPGETSDQLRALDKPEELDRYTYYVAGCVGPFWTKMCAAHLKELGGWNIGRMEELGVRFGKGLQLCNVLRDIPKDLRIGRCYLPASELAMVGLKPADLLSDVVETAVPGGSMVDEHTSTAAKPPGTATSTTDRLRPLYDRYLDLALAHLAAGWEYTMAVPRTLPRLRLACAWPILIGLKTVAKLRNNPDILHPDRRIKISRNEVYGIMLRTFFVKRSDAALNLYYERLVQQAMEGKG